MVHKVEHLRLELNANTFSDRKLFLDRKVGIFLPRRFRKGDRVPVRFVNAIVKQSTCVPA